MMKLNESLVSSGDIETWRSLDIWAWLIAFNNSGSRKETLKEATTAIKVRSSLSASCFGVTLERKEGVWFSKTISETIRLFLRYSLLKRFSIILDIAFPNKFLLLRRPILNQRCIGEIYFSMKRRIEKLITEFDFIRKFKYRSMTHRNRKYKTNSKNYREKLTENIDIGKTENQTFYTKKDTFQIKKRKILLWRQNEKYYFL